MDLNTTIVAVSSPSGNSSRALVRASGEHVFNMVQQLGLVTVGRKLTSSILHLPEGELPVLCMSFPANTSYTGQETIEVSLPNNQKLIDSLMGQIIAATSGKHAEAGEFTARAFFNGRISLSEAEGVCATISANNDGELRGAALLREGALHTQVVLISDELRNLLSLVESGIDFTDEEDVVVISDEELLQSIRACIETITAILSGKISMATLALLPKVVIAGLPNSGKSTLFNSFIGHHRVIVSNTAGTTRDAIQEPVLFGDKEAMLIDIAGFEEGKDQLSQSSQRVAQAMVRKADVVLYCVAPDDVVPKCKENTLVVHTKSDLQTTTNKHSVCAMSGEGLENLRVEIEERLYSVPHASEDALAILPRQERHLHQAQTSLVQAKVNYRVRELAATSLRESLNAIGAISGAVSSDEVLGEVFASFCIGK